MSNTGKPVTQRQLRVGEMIKQSLSMIFIRGEAKIPEIRTKEITVTEVRMSPDLKTAKVFVLPLGGKNSEEIINKLKEFSFIVRKVLSKKIIMKFLPKLFFVSKLGNFASSLINIIPNACLIISPTLSCLCETGFPNLLINLY